MCKILADISDRLLSPLVPVITEGCIERCASYHHRLLSELSDEPITFIEALSLAFGCRFVIIQSDALAKQSNISHVTVVDADIVADMQWSTELNWDFVASSSFHSVILASSRKAWLDFTGVHGEAHVGNVWLLGSNDRSNLLSFEEKRLQQLLVSFGFLEPCGSEFVQLHQIQEDTFAGLSGTIPASLAFHQLNQKPLDGLSGSSNDEVRHIEEVYNHLRIKGLFRVTYEMKAEILVAAQGKFITPSGIGKPPTPVIIRNNTSFCNRHRTFLPIPFLREAIPIRHPVSLAFDNSKIKIERSTQFDFPH
jgi:hypothetical protein